LFSEPDCAGDCAKSAPDRERNDADEVRSSASNRAMHLVATDSIYGASTEQAVANASAWLGSMHDDSPANENG
jgi:hypothetical protein